MCNCPKGARERAESFDQDPDTLSPRLRPLLAGSPSPSPRTAPNDPSQNPATLPRAAVDVDTGHGLGVVTAEPQRQLSLNYQSTAETRRRSRKVSSEEQQQQEEQAQQPPSSRRPSQLGGEQEEPPWKRTLRYFKSVELENKGSVARDHLALGADDPFPVLRCA